MIQIYHNLFIGNESDYENQVRLQSDWYIVHAWKEPYHRNLLGYSGKGAPKDHPEYLVAIRGKRLFLNLVDAADPNYIPKTIIDAALLFIDQALSAEQKCLVHCNLGESRSPSIGLLYLASKQLIPNQNLEIAEFEFRKIYPTYNPKSGIRSYLIGHWGDYCRF
ncbi:dual specificity protein phosphatase family protein [Leptospira bouyouniensis]|uniref:Phosphatase n=1 Tax=Leptospira bouyouniensis TaxID=2484911 RepID=A0ABY2L7Y6_9LEPT|nr:dual specificity protein phosphatase family protein [Leptospira bouyouniensis]TGK52763.1 phosphatase [Leptospira bouyouniensis]